MSAGAGRTGLMPTWTRRPRGLDRDSATTPDDQTSTRGGRRRAPASAGDHRSRTGTGRRTVGCASGRSTWSSATCRDRPAGPVRHGQRPPFRTTPSGRRCRRLIIGVRFNAGLRDRVSALRASAREPGDGGWHPGLTNTPWRHRAVTRTDPGTPKSWPPYSSWDGAVAIGAAYSRPPRSLLARRRRRSPMSPPTTPADDRDDGSDPRAATAR
jgi:hypothetical protein